MPVVGLWQVRLQGQQGCQGVQGRLPFAPRGVTVEHVQPQAGIGRLLGGGMQGGQTGGGLPGGEKARRLSLKIRKRARDRYSSYL